MKKRFNQTIVLGLATLIAALAFAVACASPTPTTVPTPTATPKQSPTATPTTAATPTTLPTATLQPSGAYTQAVINGHTFRLEVADDPAKRTVGLMDRPSLPDDIAMLFVFPQEGIYPFWMKDTLIPLDILFIDKELKIASIHTMQPEPGVPDDQLRRYEPPVPVIYAIEMNAGLAQRYGFALGMRVELK